VGPRAGLDAVGKRNIPSLSVIQSRSVAAVPVDLSTQDPSEDCRKERDSKL
jgi:hypothetical protein